VIDNVHSNENESDTDTADRKAFRLCIYEYDRSKLLNEPRDRAMRRVN